MRAWPDAPDVAGESALPASGVNRRGSSKSGTPGGTRTPNLRFWRPLLCQLSYWRTLKPLNRKGGQSKTVPPRDRVPTPRGRHHFVLLVDLGDDAGADGTTVVVLIATVIFAVYLWGCDIIFYKAIDFLFSKFGATVA